jgi:hypothetical protein
MDPSIPKRKATHYHGIAILKKIIRWTINIINNQIWEIKTAWCLEIREI